MRSFNTFCPAINLMARVIFRASGAILRDFGEINQLQSSRRGADHFVSACDKRMERMLYEGFNEAHPGCNFLMEEAGWVMQGHPSGPLLIIDPIDGTTNFSRGIPHFCISVAHKQDGLLNAAMTYDPIKDEIFWAVRGRGAFMNQTRLRVSGRQKLDEAVLATSVSSIKQMENPKPFRDFQKLTLKSANVRLTGSVALDLAYVAAGRHDGFWSHHPRPFDIAAGILMIQEAGGFVSDTFSRDTLSDRVFIAGNENIYKLLSKEELCERNEVLTHDIS